MYTGHTPAYPEHLRKANEVASILAILKENPGNRYWTRRLIACAPAPLPSDGRQWDEPSAEEVEAFWAGQTTFNGSVDYGDGPENPQPLEEIL